MDQLAEHESFLRAIYDAPGDDTPRLVYADFLEENGEPERAIALRSGAGLPAPWKAITVSLDSLFSPVEFRWNLVRNCPGAFAVEGVRLCSGRITSSEPLDILFGLAAFARVTELHLGGEVEEVTGGPQTEQAGTFALIDLDVRPVITAAGVEALARHRGARRITSLILTDNNLDNDAARALARSPYLVNLKRLEFRQGNNLRGRTWQQLIERFGEGVVE
jgi:uncharacterized protein (TIGR02996 family)